jgi:hypothetical protein
MESSGPLAGLNSFETHGFDADSLRLLQIRSCFKFHADTINKKCMYFTTYNWHVNHI